MTDVHACRGEWNYLTVQLARTSEDEDGDPDLYGMFTGGTSGQVLTYLPRLLLTCVLACCSNLFSCPCVCAMLIATHLLLLCCACGAGYVSFLVCFMLWPLSMRTNALQSQRPTNATYGYDFRETSAASHAVVVQKVRKADFQDKDYTGVRCYYSIVPSFSVSSSSLPL